MNRIFSSLIIALCVALSVILFALDWHVKATSIAFLGIIALLFSLFGVSLRDVFAKDEAKWKRDRAEAIELVKYIISPAIGELQNRIEKLERGEFDYSYEMRNLSNPLNLNLKFSSSKYKSLYDCLKRRRTKLGERIGQHDEAYTQLEKGLTELYGALMCSDTRVKIQQMIDEYNSKRQKKVEVTPEIVAEWLTNSFIPTAFGQEHNYEFYEEFKKQFLEVLDDSSVKQKRENINAMSKRLATLSEQVKQELQDIRGKLVKRYSLLTDEIYP
jgi:hypothetical protein